MRVESARVRDHPQLGAAERLVLPPADRPRPVEALAVGRQPDDRDHVRSPARHILGEDWMPQYVAKANAGGIERVLV